jgi:hypothetical protein
VPDDFDDDDETYQLADEAMDQADDEETAAHHDILAIRFIGKGRERRGRRTAYRASAVLAVLPRRCRANPRRAQRPRH